MIAPSTAQAVTTPGPGRGRPGEPKPPSQTAKVKASNIARGKVEPIAIASWEKEWRGMSPDEREQVARRLDLTPADVEGVLERAAAKRLTEPEGGR